MKRLPFLLLISGLTATLALSAFWSPGAQADSKRRFTLDVAMGTLASGINFADVGSGQGTVVLASGNIFAGRTIPSGASMFDPNGSEAIGIWRCQFVGLAPDDFPLTAAVTYFFQLDGTGNGSGQSMIIVQGLNSHPIDESFMPDVENSVPRVHAVVGGTGKFARASGTVREEVIGTNQSGNRSLRFKFRLRGVGDDDDDD